jgi:FMN phosphatase YigB (HAD superfamily)
MVARRSRDYERTASLKFELALNPIVAVTFDLFGTLVSVDRPDDPAAAIAEELSARGVAVPTDWATVYRQRHIDAPAGAEVPLPAHVAAALRSRDVQAPNNAARRAVVAAFDPAVRTRDGAVRAVAAARDAVSVGLVSNCSVPELVGRTLARADLSRSTFDAIVTSVGCGWRKPHKQVFTTAADVLDTAPDRIVHVGDDPATDGGIEAVDGQFVDVSEVPLTTVATRLDSGEWP